jgi:hypothetical protein
MEVISDLVKWPRIESSGGGLLIITDFETSDSYTGKKRYNIILVL